MRMTLYREPNRFRRIANAISERIADTAIAGWYRKQRQVWQTDRYMPAKINGIPVPLYRIRFWPVHLVQLVGCWIGFNILFAFGIMLGYGAPPSKWDAMLQVLFAPLFFIFG